MRSQRDQNGITFGPFPEGRDHDTDRLVGRTVRDLDAG